jgi:hypothetical protein
VCGANKNKRGATFAQRSRIIPRTLPPTHTPVKAVIFTVFAMMAQEPRSLKSHHPDRSAGSIALPRDAGAMGISCSLATRLGLPPQKSVIPGVAGVLIYKKK